MYTALLPVLALIGLGYGVRRTRFLDPAFWPSAERLTYFVLMPMLLVHSLSTKNFSGVDWSALLVAVYGPLLVTAGALMLVRRLPTGLDAAAFTSVFQGGIRFNTYIGLALASAFYGPAGLAAGAIIAGLMIVLINTLCVSCFALLLPGRAGAGRIAHVAGNLARNPLIIACLIGGTLNATGLAPTGAVGAALRILGDTALPIGLMCVGASLHFAGAKSHLAGAALASVAKFVMLPGLAALLVAMLGLATPLAPTLILFTALPTAPSAYILARQLGGDHEMMASIVTLQTIAALVTLPVTLRLLAVT